MMLVHLLYMSRVSFCFFFFFFQAEDGIRDDLVTGVQTCALPISAIWRKAADDARALDGDTGCAQVVEDNIRKIQRPDLDMARWLDEDRFFGARYALKSAMNSTHRIDIPTLRTQSWQDEQVGTRIG